MVSELRKRTEDRESGQTRSPSTDSTIKLTDITLKPRKSGYSDAIRIEQLTRAIDMGPRSPSLVGEIDPQWFILPCDLIQKDVQ